MNADQQPDHGGDHDEPRSMRAALPMILAGVLVLVILAWILISALVKPTEERLNDSAKVQHTVNQMYSAMGTLNYEAYRGVFCSADLDAPDFPSSVEFADENRTQNEADGRIVVPEMDVEVTGERATVTAHWHRENDDKARNKTELTLVNEGDEWKVCGR